LKLRDAYSAYIYDNTLYVQQITGKVLRNALEQDARYFVQLDPANLPATPAATKDPNARDYNWDLYSGIDYTIDLTRPAGQRVTRLQLGGKDVTDDQVIRIAINNYRAGGGGYNAFAGSPILWKSADGVRDYLAAYVAAHPALDPSAINVCNFTLVPDLYARYFGGTPAKCSSPFTASTSSPAVLPPGQVAQLRVVTSLGTDWAFTWSDGLTGAQAGTFTVVSSGGQSDATYTPASCSVLGPGDHAVTATVNATKVPGSWSYTIPFTFTVSCAPVAVKVLAINDFHGQISAGQKIGSAAVGGAGVLAAYLKNAMAGKEGRTILVEAGDLVGASPASSALLQDEPTISFFNSLANASCGKMPPLAQQTPGIERFDALFDPGCNLVGVPGNHEFDEGVDELMRLLGGGNHPSGPFLDDPWGGARFPVISANIWKADGELLFRPYVVKIVSGVPVAFIGATLQSTPSIVVPSGVAGLTFGDEADAINAQVKELQAQGIHAFVAVIHDGAYTQAFYAGPTDPNQPGPSTDLLGLVARLDADVDVAVTAHTHWFTNALVKNAGGKDVLCVQAYNAGKDYADVDLVVDPVTDEIVSKTAQIVATYASGVTPDPAMLALTAAAEARVAPLTSQVIGQTTAVILRTQTAGGESPLGDLVAEAHRVAMGADFGITNPGGLRADLPVSCSAGGCNITWNDCFTAQPFANQVMKVTLTGQQLKDTLEQQFVGCNGQSQTRMLQISGFKYSWSGSGTCGNRVASLTQADGTPIDMGARYAVAMNNFLQGGGDGFTTLKAGTNVSPGPVDLDALVAYLKAMTASYVPATDGRAMKLP
jgi:5'-nucleotidase